MSTIICWMSKRGIGNDPPSWMKLMELQTQTLCGMMWYRTARTYTWKMTRGIGSHTPSSVPGLAHYQLPTISVDSEKDQRTNALAVWNLKSCTSIEDQLTKLVATACSHKAQSYASQTLPLIYLPFGTIWKWSQNETQKNEEGLHPSEWLSSWYPVQATCRSRWAQDDGQKRAAGEVMWTPPWKSAKSMNLPDTTFDWRQG